MGAHNWPLFRPAISVVVGWCCLQFVGACAGPPPALAPVTPLIERSGADGRVQREYDTDGDGAADFAERLGGDGRVAELLRRSRGDSDWQVIRRDGAPNGTSNPGALHTAMGQRDRRHLLIILDSVPYEMVRDLWAAGRFRLFYPPIRTIPPFPVMTDLSLSEFFGCSPCPGVESAYFDGQKLVSGYSTYVNQGNVPWHRFMQYYMNTTNHAWTYLWPDAWFDHELRGIQEAFMQSTTAKFNAYCVGSSALGAQYGRDGHLRGLVRVDRFCRWIEQHCDGRVDITLMSDHGHNLMHSSRIPLPETLARCGYHVGDHLANPDDVVIPEFGPVTCAAIHTHQPARVARDVVGIAGVQMTSYVDTATDEIVVLSRGGEARIARTPDGRFDYRALRGDPLKLDPILAHVRSQASVAPPEPVDDASLYRATLTAPYPDPVHRLWRAFHGLIEHTPDVLVDVEDGYHCGSPFMSRIVDLAAAHGNLGQLSSSGFCMTTAGALPNDTRMEDLAKALTAVGFEP